MARVSVESVKNVQVRIKAEDYEWIGDEPPDVGDGMGPGPYDLLLGALGSCMTMTLLFVCSAKRGRLWLNDGSITRLKPERKGHVWAYDFVSCRTEDGRAVRLLTVIDEYTRECMAIQAARRIRSDDVMHTLTSLF
ncbi:MAG TPA: hypothetical protein EYG09_10810 [Dehalococcoidia bacterium]|jgi:organic hydroperoxide reductase OsmC/OhrA|nr:hypothetical protein [Dehalococcoidia bacterium]